MSHACATATIALSIGRVPAPAPAPVSPEPATAATAPEAPAPAPAAAPAPHARCVGTLGRYLRGRRRSRAGGRSAACTSGRASTHRSRTKRAAHPQLPPMQLALRQQKRVRNGVGLEELDVREALQRGRRWRARCSKVSTRTSSRGCKARHHRARAHTGVRSRSRERIGSEWCMRLSAVPDACPASDQVCNRCMLFIATNACSRARGVVRRAAHAHARAHASPRTTPSHSPWGCRTCR